MFRYVDWSFVLYDTGNGTCWWKCWFSSSRHRQWFSGPLFWSTSNGLGKKNPPKAAPSYRILFFSQRAVIGERVESFVRTCVTSFWRVWLLYCNFLFIIIYRKKYIYMYCTLEYTCILDVIFFSRIFGPSGRKWVYDDQGVPRKSIQYIIHKSLSNGHLTPTKQFSRLKKNHIHQKTNIFSNIICYI